MRPYTEMALNVLQESTKKYGRNVMAVAAAILVLGADVGIKINNLVISVEGQPGYFSFWCLLAGILIYYAVRFSVNLRIDWLAGSSVLWKHRRNLRNFKKAHDAAVKGGDESSVAKERRKLSNERPISVEFWRTCVLDIAVPAALCIVAAIMAGIKIIEYWPSPGPGA
ncbi:MAG: hypothetical protein HOJ06_19930 [Rhodospirillaceae bacterium]|nr:hypothetical protein [Rhodospirillaceae bacterium]